MRTVSLLKWGCLALILAACGNEAEAGKTATTDTESAATAETRLVVVTNAPKEPLTTISEELITDCVGYVPYAAATGNFFMQVIWNDYAKQDVAQLRTVCEEMGHTDPEGLQRISDEKKAVDKFFENVIATASTIAGGGPPTAAPAPVPGAIEACGPGLALGPTGFCEPATP